MIIKCKNTIRQITDSTRKKKNINEAQITIGVNYIVISVEIRLQHSDRSVPIRCWIIDDNGLLMPYNSDNFSVVDGYIPKSWIYVERGEGMDICHEKWGREFYLNDYFDELDTELEYNEVIRNLYRESLENSGIDKGALNLPEIGVSGLK